MHDYDNSVTWPPLAQLRSNSRFGLALPGGIMTSRSTVSRSQDMHGQWYVFDPAQASQLLQAAGYSATNKLTWEHVTWYDRVTAAEVIIPALNENLPEVEVTFRQVDNPTQVTML